MIIGLFLIAFDYVVSPDGLIKLDLLPDFIGYGIFAYGFFKIMRQEKCHEADSGSKTVLAQKKERSGDKGSSQGKNRKVVVSKNYRKKGAAPADLNGQVTNSSGQQKNSSGQQKNSSGQQKNSGGQRKNRSVQRNKESSEALNNTLRYGMITACVLMLIFYVVYLLDLYGKLQRMPQGVSFGFSILKDMGLLLLMYWYITVLTALQVKRLSLILKITALCMLCECISLSVEIVMLTFILFERMAEIVFMVYMWDADRKYKKHYRGNAEK